MEKEAAYFKVLSDSTRLRLVILLAVQGETCVCKLSEALKEPEYKISRHLGILRNGGVVEARRERTWMYYKLCPPANALEQCLQECFHSCFESHPTARVDINRLHQSACTANPMSIPAEEIGNDK